MYGGPLRALLTNGRGVGGRGVVLSQEPRRALPRADVSPQPLVPELGATTCSTA